MAVIFILLTFVIHLTRGRIIIDEPTSIHNGELTNIEEYPFYAHITLLNDDHHCGGAIIKENLVLTAAHCLLRRFGKLQVYVGIDHVEQMKDTKPYMIRKKIRHAKYDDDYEAKYDVGLALLKKHIQFAGFKIAAVQLAMEAPSIGADVSIIGFGKVQCDYNHAEYECKNEYSDSLRSAVVNVINVDEYGVIHTKGKHQNTCDGDSGSPVIYDGEVIGVVSTGQFDNCTGHDVQAPIVPNYSWLRKYLEF